jgi:iron uptake system EfeUOB component EfeO/EfeM
MKTEEFKMKQRTALIVVLSIALVSALSACGKKEEAAGPKETPSASSNVHEVSLKDGTAKLLKTAKQIRKAATAGDEAKVRELGPQLEEAWSAYEDAVKPKYADVYEQVEKNLDPAIAASKATPLNKDALLKIDNDLIQVLYDFSAKLIPVEDIKAGTNQMLTTTGEMKKEIDAGNETKVKELGPKLEEVWATFEDGLRPRNADLYEKIEKSLNPEVTGSQKSPLDKQILTTLNNDLTTSLNELLQTLK